MRFTVELLSDRNLIPKDKNRLVLSILKSCFSSYSQDYYKKLYETKENQIKDFTFSLYLGECKFLRDEILIPEKKIFLNFSTYSYEDGIMFYNSFLSNKGKEFNYKDNIIQIGKLSLKKEKPIYSNEVVFKTMSPIVVREHGGNNKKTWYHSLGNNEGLEVFKENLKHQLIDTFADQGLKDFNDLDITVSNRNKEVKVKNYDIELLTNITKIKISGQPYILDYLYKAGIGSKRSSGFGMVDIV